EPSPVRVLDGDGFAAALIDLGVALRDLAARLLRSVFGRAHDNRRAALTVRRLKERHDLARQPAAPATSGCTRRFVCRPWSLTPARARSEVFRCGEFRSCSSAALG